MTKRNDVERDDEAAAAPPEQVPVSTTSENTNDAAGATATATGATNNNNNLPNFKRVSWFDQFYWCLWKNSLLLLRRPIMLVLVLLSSVVSMIISWAAGGRDPEAGDVIYPPESAFTDCGSVNQTYIESLDYDDQYKVQLTLNENWRGGLPVAMMGLGPLFLAIWVFTMVQGELNAQLLGVLRALGLRDSVYWLSWYIPFANIALLNALLGAITAQTLQGTGHVYESVYFGGVFASLLFLNLSLVSASLFLVAFCGMGRSKVCTNFTILILILAAFIPAMVLAISSSVPYPSNLSYFNEYPPGLFWQNTATYSSYSEYYYDEVTGNSTYTTISCNQPVMNEQQGTWYKTEEERAEVQSDEYFIGCYMKASYPTVVWKQTKVAQRFFMFFFPYFHFQNIWGNFVGYTAMPNREFGSHQATLSADELAIEALPMPPPPNPLNINDDTGSDMSATPTMAPQGSTFVMATFWYDFYSHGYTYDDWISLSTCPLEGNGTEANVCPYSTNCVYAENPGAQYGAPSVADSIGMLFALSVLYLLLAGYWATVFCRGNGNGEKFYFVVLPSYWRCGGSGGGGDHHQPDHQSSLEGVTIQGLKKSYGNFDAVKSVSFKMNAGEVTALLGHNGAGKTTLSNILCCEIPGTEGEIRVFGHSVFQDAHTVRGMVGLCKQDDYLWPNLSAKEHLELFAGLRGVASTELATTVQKWLESVDLEDVQFQYSSGFSGGMKRRLSVALATIGDRPLIVLDEPTTGMDPVSRRFVWRHIDAIKEGRVILLTTHAMEEADLLADEVAIMRKGELAAFGSPLQLKTEHGTALQFSILVDKARAGEATEYIEHFFFSYENFVDIEPSDAGNIVVKISALKDHAGGEGVEVSALTSFVSWLDSKESPVSEYGFSNSSLEEVFLKVTEGDEEENQEGMGANDYDTVFVDEDDVEAAESSNFDKLSSFTANLSIITQTSVITASLLRRGWTGRGSIGNYCVYGTFLLGSIVLMLGVAWNEYPLPALSVVVFFISILLIAIIGPVYADRFEGQFYLLRSQGLLPFAYIAGLSLHAFAVQFAYNLLTLTGIFATPFFRDSELCNSTTSSNDCNWSRFGERQKVTNPTEIWNFEDTYKGEPVKLQAIRAPGGYDMVFGVALAAAIATVGQTLTSAFFPGYRLPLVMIMFLTVTVSVLPLLPVLLGKSEEGFYECSNTTNPDFICDSTFSGENVTEDFVNCVGFQVNFYAYNYFCAAPSAALLSQFGIFQMLSMSYMSKVTFISEPAGYVEDILIPSLDGVKCKNDTCSFPFANRLYGLNFLFTILGGVILIGLGILMAYVLVFPIGPFLRLRQTIGRYFGSCSCSRRPGKSASEEMEEGEELPEVGEERDAVHGIMKPILNDGVDTDEQYPSLDHALIPRSGIAPVVTHKLRKVYPALGGRPPKIALESLDLHVPKGEVLGLLGKNGAGKTTALKILAGAHDSSGGIGLVSGYDCDLEKISVFERLGNCAQFDVVWKGQTVQRHLEFFAALKGLPRKEIKPLAKAIADAVGLGSDAVYARNAGSLSGGMRRRLSIGMALIGSPSVVILDEPTTGLDPSTRSTIWSLIHSFASKERSMIITTHMMIEADTLCNRIAIVAHGKLVVVGTQQHLKNKFGDGYVLQLNLVHSSPEYQERAMEFVRKRLHPDARLGIRQAKTLHVNLPRGVSLEKVFKALYSQERTTEGGINQFLLSQSSLEDVFIALGD